MRRRIAGAHIMYKIKILLGFLQVASFVVLANDVPWPQSTRAFYKYGMGWSIVDWIPWQQVGCLVYRDFYHQLFAATITPLLLLAVALVSFLLPAYISCGRGARAPVVRTGTRLMLAQSELRHLEKKKARRKFWKVVFFACLLVYPLIVSRLASFFHCRSVNGVSYLAPDLRLRCYDSQWYAVLPFALTCIAVYALGIPAWFFYTLRRYRGRYRELDVQVQMGFLVLAYRQELWWFEVLDLAYKAAIVCAPRFVRQDYQMVVAMLLSGLYLIALILLRPYVRKGDDRLHLVVVASVFCIALAGQVLVEASTALDAVLIEVLLVLLPVHCFFLFLVMTVRVSLKFLWGGRRHRVNVEALQKHAVSGSVIDLGADSRLSVSEFSGSRSRAGSRSRSRSSLDVQSGKRMASLGSKHALMGQSHMLRSSSLNVD